MFFLGKDEKDCMFEQTGLGLFIFDENKLIAVSLIPSSSSIDILRLYLFKCDGLITYSFM